MTERLSTGAARSEKINTRVNEKAITYLGRIHKKVVAVRKSFAWLTIIEPI